MSQLSIESNASSPAPPFRGDRPEDVMTFRELAERLPEDGPSKRTIERWAKAGRFDTYTLSVGGKTAQGASLSALLALLEPQATPKETWQRTHEAVVATIEDHEQKISQLVEAYTKTLERLERSYARACEALDRQHADDLEGLAQAHLEARSELERSHEAAREDLRASHHCSIESLEQAHAAHLSDIEARQKDAVLWGRIAIATGVLALSLCALLLSKRAAAADGPVERGSALATAGFVAE